MILKCIVVVLLSKRDVQQLEIVLTGRLANNMFQLASAYGIAHDNGYKLCSQLQSDDLRSPELQSIFQGPLPQTCERKGGMATLLKETVYATFQPFFLRGDVVIQNSYLQSWKYFESLEDTIRNKFLFKPFIQEEAKRKRLHCPTPCVGIHVRRADIADGPMSGYLKLPSSSYYRSAINYFKAIFKNPWFLVVSDDIDWCRRQSVFLKNQVRFADTYTNANYSSVVDLALLSYCDGLVLSVGSFGWWAAWLANQIPVVYYRDTFVLNHTVNFGVKVNDFYLPQWIPLSNSLSELVDASIISLDTNGASEIRQKLMNGGIKTTLSLGAKPSDFSTTAELAKAAFGCENTPTPWISPTLTPGEMALALSHRNVWEQHAKNFNGRGPGRWLIVLEDDALIHPEININLLPAHLLKHNNVGFVYLGLCYSHEEKIAKCNSYSYGDSCQSFSSGYNCSGWCTHAFAITQERALTLHKALYDCGMRCTPRFNPVGCQTDQSMVSAIQSGRLVANALGPQCQSPCHTGHYGIFYQNRCNQFDGQNVGSRLQNAEQP